MPITMTPIEASKARVPLDEIDPDVAQAVEDAYVFCQTSDQRLQAPFESKQVAEEFLHEARSYAYQREAGRLVVTGNPAGKDSKAFARFRVEPFVKKDESGGE